MTNFGYGLPVKLMIDVYILYVVLRSRDATHQLISFLCVLLLDFRLFAGFVSQAVADYNSIVSF